MSLSNPFGLKAHHLLQARDVERERIARDIHDVLGATLAALKFEIHLVGRTLESRQSRTPDVELARVLQRIRAIGTLVDEAVHDARNLVKDHHPGLLRERGLLAAVEDQAVRFSRRTGINCMVSHNEDLSEPEPDIALALFRSLQEALTNVLRHSSASRVVVRMRTDSTRISLQIEDDGIGFSANENRRLSHGLLNMRDRLRIVGGTCQIESTPGSGTRIVLSAPLKSPVITPALQQTS